MHLYELPVYVRSIDDMIAEAEGEITPEIKDAMEMLTTEISDKVDWISTVIRERSAVAAGYKAEIDRLNALKKAEERHAESLKSYLKETMVAMNVSKVDGKLSKASLVKNGKPSLSWTRDIDSLPEEFRRVTVDVNLSAAQDALAAGSLPEGFQATYGTSLRLR